MKYYCMMVRTGEEERFKQSALEELRGFCRFLMSNTDIRPLAGESLSVFENFLRCGESLGLSRLKFEPGRRIVVIDGPLKGLEGNVIAVNKRQRRVTRPPRHDGLRLQGRYVLRGCNGGGGREGVAIDIYCLLLFFQLYWI